MEGTIQNDHVYNLLVNLLDGKTLTLKFSSPELSACSIKHLLYHLTGIPPQQQRLFTGIRSLNDDSSLLSCSPGEVMFPTVHLLLPLVGGKGGFGSLLRGAATKAGQKKTKNFDACRDMSGRRLRHVNAEKKLEEWKAEEEQRKLEKLAEDFLKKASKQGTKGVGDNEAQKYVAKYREVSERCAAEVAETVKEALISAKGKRKGLEAVKDAAEAKKLKIWMGKRKLGESESDDSDDDDVSDNEEGNEKSIVLNNGSLSDLSKGTEDSSGSVSDGKQDGQFSGLGSIESGSEEEKDNVLPEKQEVGECLGRGSFHAEASNGVEPGILDKITSNAAKHCSQPVIVGTDATDYEMPSCNGPSCVNMDVVLNEASNTSCSVNMKDSTAASNMETDDSHKHKLAGFDVKEPLHIDNFNSVAELEILGMERLKSELQAHGLKCGGTLQERASRLFLLKSTPLDKLPKKLFAKK